MSDIKESPVIIPMIERDPVLEEKVQYYLQLVQPFTKNTLKPQRVILPDTRDDYELEIFRREEIRRIKEGHFGMSPKYYFFYNYCKMDTQDGLLRPEFRVCQQEFFKEIEKAQASQEFGLIAVKRRRIGASWMAAADVLHDCVTTPFFKVGMNSKTERDSVELFKKVKFLYDNLPEWLKPTTQAGNTRTSMDFSYRIKDSGGNWTKRGTQSQISVVAPVPTAYEGMRMNKLVVDECFGLGTKVRMGNGDIQPIENIKAGDYVMGINGTPSLVEQITQGVDDLYKIIPTKGEPFVCNSQHLLTLKFNGIDKILDIKTEDFNKIRPLKQRYFQLFRTGWDYPKNEYPFDPYWMGLWLGDGDSCGASVVAWDQEIKDYLSNYNMNDSDFRVSSYNQHSNLTSYNIACKNRTKFYKYEHKNGESGRISATDLKSKFGIGNGMRYHKSLIRKEKGEMIRSDNRVFNGEFNVLEPEFFYKENNRQLVDSPIFRLKQLGVYKNKHIPECYLKTSKEDRLKLLAGIIDSDGYKDKRKNSYEVTFKPKKLAEGLQELCISLGFYASLTLKIATMKRKDGTIYKCQVYRVGIFGNTLHEIPCRVPRKQVTKITIKERGRRDPQKSGFKIEKLGSGDYYGIRLKDDPYFLLHDGTVVHNCGKIGPLRQLWSYTQDCLMDGHKRKGCPILTGTAGDITAEGKDYKEFWYNASIYKFNQFFLAGYMGILVDDYGNDLTEEAIRWIVYERKRREGLSNKEYSDFLQQYPLTVGEAFTSNTSQGLGNLVKINSQLRKLDENPIHAKKGYFLKDSNGGVKFIPDNRGTFKIYEDVTPGVENLYVSGIDPTDHAVEDTRDVSSLSMHILKKQQGIERPKIVAEYVDRPNVPSDYYEQAILALQYYNHCKVLIERNRYGMIQFFEQVGCKYLLMTEPTGYKTVFQGTWVSRIGIHMSKTTKKILEDCVVEYVEDNCDIIPSKELLMDFKEYGARNTDLAMSMGIALIALTNDQTKLRQLTDGKKHIPNWSYKNVGGKVIRIRT